MDTILPPPPLPPGYPQQTVQVHPALPQNPLPTPQTITGGSGHSWFGKLITALENNIRFRILFFVVASSVLFFIGVGIQVVTSRMSQATYFVTLSVPRPSMLPSRYSQDPVFAFLQTVILAPDPGVIFRRVISLSFTDNKNASISLSIRKNQGYSCKNKEQIPEATSIEEVPESPLGPLCIFDLKESDGTLMRNYFWQQSGQVYDVSFPKNALSQEEIDTMLSSIELKETRFACKTKIAFFFLNLPCDPKNFFP